MGEDVGGGQCVGVERHLINVAIERQESHVRSGSNLAVMTGVGIVPGDPAGAAHRSPVHVEKPAVPSKVKARCAHLRSCTATPESAELRKPTVFRLKIQR